VHPGTHTSYSALRLLGVGRPPAELNLKCSKPWDREATNTEEEEEEEEAFCQAATPMYSMGVEKAWETLVGRAVCMALDRGRPGYSTTKSSSTPGLNWVVTSRLAPNGYTPLQLEYRHFCPSPVEGTLHSWGVPMTSVMHIQVLKLGSPSPPYMMG